MSYRKGCFHPQWHINDNIYNKRIYKSSYQSKTIYWRSKTNDAKLRNTPPSVQFMFLYNLYVKEFISNELNKIKLSYENKKKIAVTRIRTWVITATTWGTNHYTITAYVAEEGFDPSTSGLWAQHASAAPLCWELMSDICTYKHN